MKENVENWTSLGRKKELIFERTKVIVRSDETDKAKPKTDKHTRRDARNWGRPRFENIARLRRRKFVIITSDQSPSF